MQTDDLRIEESNHPLFQGITLDDMKWHFHGVFNPLPGQRTLLSDSRPDGAVILIDETHFAGKLLVTTLDPEEHAGFGEGDDHHEFPQQMHRMDPRGIRPNRARDGAGHR